MWNKCLFQIRKHILKINNKKKKRKEDEEECQQFKATRFFFFYDSRLHSRLQTVRIAQGQTIHKCRSYTKTSRFNSIIAHRRCCTCRTGSASLNKTISLRTRIKWAGRRKTKLSQGEWRSVCSVGNSTSCLQLRLPHFNIGLMIRALYFCDFKIINY